jgi:hypothetical protein
MVRLMMRCCKRAVFAALMMVGSTACQTTTSEAPAEAVYAADVCSQKMPPLGTYKGGPIPVLADQSVRIENPVNGKSLVAVVDNAEGKVTYATYVPADKRGELIATLLKDPNQPGINIGGNPPPPPPIIPWDLKAAHLVYTSVHFDAVPSQALAALVENCGLQ